jgi:hypothetical protein
VFGAGHDATRHTTSEQRTTIDATPDRRTGTLLC